MLGLKLIHVSKRGHWSPWRIPDKQSTVLCPSCHYVRHGYTCSEDHLTQQSRKLPSWSEPPDISVSFNMEMYNSIKSSNTPAWSHQFLTCMSLKKSLFHQDCSYNVWYVYDKWSTQVRTKVVKRKCHFQMPIHLLLLIFAWNDVAFCEKNPLLGLQMVIDPTYSPRGPVY